MLGTPPGSDSDHEDEENNSLEEKFETWIGTDHGDNA
jgi:hypothetical protein